LLTTTTLALGFAAAASHPAKDAAVRPVLIAVIVPIHPLSAIVRTIRLPALIRLTIFTPINIDKKIHIKVYHPASMSIALSSLRLVASATASSKATSRSLIVTSVSVIA